VNTRPHRSDGLSPFRVAIVYSLLVAVPIGAVVFMLRLHHEGPPLHQDAGPFAAPTAPAVAVAGQADRALVALAVVVVVAGLAGLACRLAGHSPVLGEMIAGIVLGPSAFGAVAPGLEHKAFPDGGSGVLSVVAQIGIVIFMFLIGLEMPLTMLRRVGRRILPVGLAAIAVPFALGIGLSLGLRGHYMPAGVSKPAFELFVALSVSVTAFPVLARILSDRQLVGGRIGTMGLAIAGIGDVLAWGALGVVTAVIRDSSATGLARGLLELIAFAGLMWAAVRPALVVVLRWVDGQPKLAASSGPLIAAFALLCAVLTATFGVHPIFGAFFAGLVMPRSSAVVADFATRTQALIEWLFLPVFFATMGLQTRLQDVFSKDAALSITGVLLVAIVGKTGGTALAARIIGEDRRSALALGVMMNCRGLTELVVLNVGLSLGVVRSDLFSVLVVMTLVTTIMTDPLLRLGGVGGVGSARSDATGHAAMLEIPAYSSSPPPAG